MCNKNIKDLKNWTEVQGDWNGHFRYVLGAKCAYEIIVWYHAVKTPILTAKASLFVTGLWKCESGDYMKRECIGENLPVQELLEIAYRDWEESTNVGE